MFDVIDERRSRVWRVLFGGRVPPPPTPGGPTYVRSRIGRLRRLRHLLTNATDDEQGSYVTCLYARAVTDPVFRMAGLHGRAGCPETSNLHDFFVGMPAVWGDQSVAQKRRLITNLINDYA